MAGRIKARMKRISKRKPGLNKKQVRKRAIANERAYYKKNKNKTMPKFLWTEKRRKEAGLGPKKGKGKGNAKGNLKPKPKKNPAIQDIVRQNIRSAAGVQRVPRRTFSLPYEKEEPRG